ncbi:hypothetical protein DFH06DRAFT_1247199 [Mycena polygramma]|nr:hypothetical protein DFH06DRAFT_1247199 [Mycena polygramma]
MSPLRTAMQALLTIWCALATSAGPSGRPRVRFVLPRQRKKKKRSNLSDPAPPVRKPMASCSGRAACGKRGRESAYRACGMQPGGRHTTERKNQHVACAGGHAMGQ